ncbi:hypothetical protein [Allomesorhizobium camelthorni]|uniref:Uncharacterized protein n=1 Tax=Allomesorhizobium camelthorni TaxID=475069 RepID=A0A6G4W6T6_9HYPH|nr:hypothetical protein [Mesorhizobium camelthorni]NGO50461.1 hypothetical protein [Mesorhizobium camelthorni]
MSDKALWAKCKECSHVWAVAYLPMELEKVAKLALAARCPKCASASIAVASKADVPADGAPA